MIKTIFDKSERQFKRDKTDMETWLNESHSLSEVFRDDDEGLLKYNVHRASDQRAQIDIYRVEDDNNKVMGCFGVIWNNDAVALWVSPLFTDIRLFDRVSYYRGERQVREMLELKCINMGWVIAFEYRVHARVKRYCFNAVGNYPRSVIRREDLDVPRWI